MSISGSTLTITGVGVGMARITVTASDGTDERRQTFSVTVGSQAPMARGVSTDVYLDVDGTATFTLSDYFMDPEDDDLTFTAVSSDDAVATVSDPDAMSMITITAEGRGVATVTVTAADSDNAAVELEFSVAGPRSGR